MNVRDDRPSHGTSRTDRRRLLESGGLLAGAAALFGGAPTADAAGRIGSTLSTRRNTMPTWRPDPTFYPSPRSAMQAPAETLAYVVRVNPTGDGRPDALTVVDVDPTSAPMASSSVRWTMTHAGDELHHFGWNACSSMLCPNAPHPHVERRYLIVPGLGSSRIYIIDTKPDPTRPRIVKTIEPEEVAERRPAMPRGTPSTAARTASTSAPSAPLTAAVPAASSCSITTPSTSSAGGRSIAASSTCTMTSGGISATTRWSAASGARRSMVESGVQPELLLDGQYGHQLHFWDLKQRRQVQTLDLGKEHQIALELRPAHDPTRAYGFVNSVVSLTDLSAYIFLWRRKDGANGAKDGWDATRSSPSRPSRRRRTSCHRPSSHSRRCRRWSPTSS